MSSITVLLSDGTVETIDSTWNTETLQWEINLDSSYYVDSSSYLHSYAYDSDNDGVDDSTLENAMIILSIDGDVKITAEGNVLLDSNAQIKKDNLKTDGGQYSVDSSASLTAEVVLISEVLKVATDGSLSLNAESLIIEKNITGSTDTFSAETQELTVLTDSVDPDAVGISIVEPSVETFLEIESGGEMLLKIVDTNASTKFDAGDKIQFGFISDYNGNRINEDQGIREYTVDSFVPKGGGRGEPPPESLQLTNISFAEVTETLDLLELRADTAAGLVNPQIDLLVLGDGYYQGLFLKDYYGNNFDSPDKMQVDLEKLEPFYNFSNDNDYVYGQINENDGQYSDDDFLNIVTYDFSVFQP